MTPERELYIKDRYLRILSIGANLTELCDFTASCIGEPVAITLTTQTIVAKSKNYTEDLVEEYRSAWELCSQAELEELEKSLHHLLCTPEPVSRAWPYSRHKRINCGCTWHGELLAVLDCPVVSNTLSEDAPYIVGMAAPIFLMALRLNSYIDVDTLNPVQTYMISLLHGTINEHQQRQHIYNSVLQTTELWRALMCKPVNDTNAEQIKSLMNTFCFRHEGIWSVEYDESIVILMDASKEKLLQILSDECEGLCQIGVSVPFTKVYDLASQLDNVHTTLRLAAFAEDAATVVCAEKYKVHTRFLSALQEDASDLTDPVLARIKKYDSEHDSEYFSTLKAYLLHRRDYKAVADLLHIHKNTVAYRIQRVSELFDLDLKDNCTIMNLYLSLFADM